MLLEGLYLQRFGAFCTDSSAYGGLVLYFMNIDLLEIGEVCTAHPNLQQSSYLNIVFAAYAE